MSVLTARPSLAIRSGIRSPQCLFLRKVRSMILGMKVGRPLSEQLRRAIEASPMSRYQLAKETGVSQSVLSLFCNKKRGLSLRAIDALAAALDLELKPRKWKES